MGDNPVMEARRREKTGSRAARRLRNSGLVPAVIYGGGIETECLAVDAEALRHLVEERARIVDVKIGREKRSAVIKDLQYDHLDSDIQHVDFEIVKMDEVLEIEVPVETHGTPKGAKNGGVLEVVLKQITVECKPADIPKEIRVEVGELEIGDTITVGEVEMPPGVRVLDDPGASVVALHPPREERELEEVAEEQMLEPELIGAEPAEGEGEAVEEEEEEA